MCYRPVWRSNGSRGYAMVDLVVGMAVFALVTAGVYQVFIPVLKFASSTNERLTVQQDVRLAMDRMARDMRESDMSRLQVYPGGTAIGLVTARAGCSGAFTVDAASGRAAGQGVASHGRGCRARGGRGGRRCRSSGGPPRWGHPARCRPSPATAAVRWPRLP